MSDETPKTKKTAPLDLPTIMNQARDQYTAEREKVLAERKQFDDRLADIDAELDKIDSYFNPRREPEPKNVRVPRPGARKPRKAGVRDEVLAKIAANADGISRKELLAAMGATEKAQEQSISNAVSALKKDGKISGDQGHYKAV